MRASAELGVVISRAGKNISETEAMDYVYGYTLVNDVCSDSWKIVALDGIDEAMMLTDLTVLLSVQPHHIIQGRQILLQLLARI